MTAVETRPETSQGALQPLELTPQEAENIKRELKGTVYYLYAERDTQTVFDDLSPKEVTALIHTWPDGLTELKDRLAIIGERVEESSPTPG